MSFWTDNDLSLVYRRFVQKAEYENAVYIFGVAVDFGACHRRRFTKIGLIRVEVRNKCYIIIIIIINYCYYYYYYYSLSEFFFFFLRI